MNSIDVSQNEYPGDEAWLRFVDVFRPEWKKLQNSEKNISKFGDEGMPRPFVHNSDFFPRRASFLRNRLGNL